jgi:ubiquinone/menaquinone biosynthesis C-methylase UbiE
MKSIYNFNQEAETYDEYYQSELGKEIDNAEKICVKKFLDKIQKGEILELGSGTGHWSKWITEQGFNVHGIDIAKDMLQKAKDKNIPNSKFEIMSMTDLEFENNSIETIIAITSLEFSIDLDKTFSEIKRVLKPNGRLITAVLNSKSTIGKYKGDNPTFINANFFTKDTLKKRLSNFGNPEFCEAAFLNENFELVEKGTNFEPAMIVGFVQNKY